LSICPCGVPSLTSKTARRPALLSPRSFSASCSPTRHASQNGELPLVMMMIRLSPLLAWLLLVVLLVLVPQPVTAVSARNATPIDFSVMGEVFIGVYLVVFSGFYVYLVKRTFTFV